MAQFHYKAKKNADELIDAVLEAASQEEAVEKISALGYFPLKVEEVKVDEPIGELSRSININFSNRRVINIASFSRQLSTLLKSGVPILAALNIIAEQSENASTKKFLAEVHNEVKNGRSLSDTLRRFKNLFFPVYLALIKAGEESGNLWAALAKISEHRRKQEEIISRLRSALAYPILMALVGLATVIFMLTFVMPRLMGIFSTLGQQLPLPTRILIITSNFLRNQWLLVVLGLLVIVVVFKIWKNTASAKKILSIISLKFPLFGKIVLKAEVARFSRTLELLVKSGIPILRAIEVSMPVMQNELLRSQILKSSQDLRQGASFGKSLKTSKLFPVFMSNLISVGEESGKLDEALSEVAEAYEQDLDEAIRIMSSLLEPLMILFMGLVVGFIVMAMLLPLFEINIAVR